MVFVLRQPAISTQSQVEIRNRILARRATDREGMIDASDTNTETGSE